MWIQMIQYFFAVFYVSGNQTFPQPLTSEEEKHYLYKFRDGDEDAKNILVERNLRLVAHIVKKYNHLNKEMDDLISIGTIGLIKAITTYNVDKGTRLATYAARCIENELLMMLRADKKQKNEISLQEPIGIDKEGNAITLNDVLQYDSESIIEQVDVKMKIKQLYEKMKEVLKAREKKVLELRYGLCNGIEKTQREVAKMLGISRSYVSRIEKKAISKLNMEMNKD